MAQTPITEALHAGGFIVSEANGHRSRERGTITGAAKLLAGAVLGKIAHGTATAAAQAGNTGNATCSAVTLAAAAQSGVYKVVYLTATRFEVYDPLGNLIGTGSNTVAFATQIGFTMTAGGTPMAAGDVELITVATATAKYKAYDQTATDGSEVAAGILYATADATSADVKQTVVVRAAEVNASELVWGSGVDAPSIAIATLALAAIGIIAR